jgi:hypothetical protein
VIFSTDATIAIYLVIRTSLGYFFRTLSDPNILAGAVTVDPKSSSYSYGCRLSLALANG